MKDGTKIQLEDWSKDYSFHKENDTIGAYPIAKKTNEESEFGAKKGKEYRLELRFETGEQADNAYNELLQGASILDYEPFIFPPTNSKYIK